MMKPVKFTLPLDSFEKDFSEFLDSKTVVISCFGMSPFHLMSCKTRLVDDVLGYQVFKTSVINSLGGGNEIMNSVEGCYSSTHKVLFLHLKGSLDTHTLVRQYQDLKDDMNEKGYLNVWAQLKHGYSRALLFLFSISHLLIINHPSSCLDISYIHLFRALDTVRLKLQPNVSEVLSMVEGVSADWATNGRFCSPRVLWFFGNCPPAFRTHIAGKLGIDWRKEDIKKVGHDLEDQIYSILRKSRVITNISTNSLFAIPANKEYVFILTEPDTTQDWIPYLVNSMVDLCRNPNIGLEQNRCSFGFDSLADPHKRSVEQKFEFFLQQHIDQAFSPNGFEDNTGRHAHLSNSFETPKLGVLVRAANALYSLLVTSDDTSAPALTTLHSLLDTDIKFSEARCSKVLPLAIATYQENLPANYTKEYHLNKVSHALGVFGEYARGPQVESYIAQLQKECERHWKSGRQLCEVLSMTGHPCQKPLHKGGSGEQSPYQQDNSRTDLPVMEHWSNIHFISACDCGRKQGSREDPFSVRTANHDYYHLLDAECGCDMLDRVHFPVFQPSTQDYRAAQLFSTLASTSRKDNAHTPSRELGTQPCNTQGLSLAYVSGHSGGENSDMLGEHPGGGGHPRTSAPSLTEAHQIVIQVSDADQDSIKEKSLVRQPSTTEYLPGMLHSDSPISLLPQFPSWSLLCLGPSSLYSHNLGLQEQQQAGMLGGSAYLLPWDVIVRLEQTQKDRFWPTVGEQTSTNRNKIGQPAGLSKSRKTKSGKDLSEFNVKIFVGVEYECPRGHRFMCSAPDKVLKTSGSGLVKDNGNKVTGCDMPLYFPCPCRAAKPVTAQLMRVHVVTPKAPVHVTLNPRVQPTPSSPIFITGCQEPLRLSQSAYWVLRLPFVYVGDHGPYLPPKDPLPTYGRLLAGMYGISEITDSKL